MAMNWNQLLSPVRLGMENYHDRNRDNRNEFQRDYDRLIFSAPFRRLQNKTQVFPLPGSVFVHNRLTHSLEVASVGRSLGMNVSQSLAATEPGYVDQIGFIVSAACLAHDLGNPPFGHSGEEAIATFFSEGKGQFLKNEMSEVECQCFPLTGSSVQRTPSGWFCAHLQHTGFYCQISVFFGLCRSKKTKIWFF